MAIDHRIVSVVQLGDERPTEISETSTPRVAHHRPILESVSFVTRGHSGQVEVNLRWPTGEETAGSCEAGSSRDARARAAVTALLEALDPALLAIQARVDLEHVIIHPIGSSDSVLIRATFYEGRIPTPVIGSALVNDDIATAAVRALLHAINRKLP
jgi:hypothetical protein